MRIDFYTSRTIKEAYAKDISLFDRHLKDAVFSTASDTFCTKKNLSPCLFSKGEKEMSNSFYHKDLIDAHRNRINAILWIIKSGARWRDLPSFLNLDDKTILGDKDYCCSLQQIGSLLFQFRFTCCLCFSFLIYQQPLRKKRMTCPTSLSTSMRLYSITTRLMSSNSSARSLTTKSSGKSIMINFLTFTFLDSNFFDSFSS